MYHKRRSAKYLSLITLLIFLISTFCPTSAFAADLFTVPTNATQLANHLLATNSEITITDTPTITGKLSASSMFTNLNLGEMNGVEYTLPDGILVTTGDGTPPTSNTSQNYTAELDQSGDADVEEQAGVTDSQDAFTLQFNFTVPVNTPSVQFAFMFGSDEYPEYLDDIVDGAAVIVDGVNYAKFPGDIPLKVVSEADMKLNNGLNIEYDGMSAPRKITALLDPERDVHTVKIVIADTTDMAYDTGLFLSAMKTSNETTGGIQTPSQSVSAELASVAGQTDSTPGSQTGVIDDAIQWEISVPYSKDHITLDDIVPTDVNATVELFSDTAFTESITSLSLPAGSTTPAYICITAKDGTTKKYYDVAITRPDLPSSSSTPSSSNGGGDSSSSSGGSNGGGSSSSSSGGTDGGSSSSSSSGGTDGGSSSSSSSGGSNGGGGSSSSTSGTNGGSSSSSSTGGSNGGGGSSSSTGGMNGGSGSSSTGSSSNSSGGETDKIPVIQTPKDISDPDKIIVTPVGQAFNQAIEVRLKDDPVVESQIRKSLNQIQLTGTAEKARIYPLDISMYLKGTNTKVQPKEGTSVEFTVPIPAKLLNEKEKLVVVCIVNGKLNVLPTSIVTQDGTVCVKFTASHFSPYGFVVDTDGKLAALASGNINVPKTGENNLVIPIVVIACIISASLFILLHRKAKRV